VPKLLTARCVVYESNGGAATTCVTSQMTLAVIGPSVTTAHGLHYWRTRWLTPAPGTTFSRHVTLLTNPDTRLLTARVVT